MDMIETVARGIYEGEGWKKTDGTPIPWEDVPEEHGHYMNGARGAIKAIRRTKDSPLDEMRKVNRIALILSVNQEIGAGHVISAKEIYDIRFDTALKTE